MVMHYQQRWPFFTDAFSLSSYTLLLEILKQVLALTNLNITNRMTKSAVLSAAFQLLELSKVSPDLTYSLNFLINEQINLMKLDGGAGSNRNQVPDRSGICTFIELLIRMMAFLYIFQLNYRVLKIFIEYRSI